MNSINNSLVETKKPKFSVAIRSDTMKKLINDTLGDSQKAVKFIADITSVVSNNYQLQTCETGSVVSAGLQAQSLNLPLSPTLGFAYVVPYGGKAQFQIGWKGLVQLALRTAQYSKIGVKEIYEGNFVKYNDFGEPQFDFNVDTTDKPIVGYMAYFELTNGFQKIVYWTKEQCDKHAHTYSKSYGTGKATDNWTNNFNKMALKTVLKQLISQWGIMSTELEKAIKYDQAVIDEHGNADYVDNESDDVFANEPSAEEVLEEQKKEE